MKALTICNPYPELILPPLLEKPIENRTWATAYRGPLYIHAGKSRAWLEPAEDYYQKCYPEMVFGAIVGVADLVACLWLDATTWPAEFEPLRDHPHANGPCCWVLANPRRLSQPVPCRGAQGLWNVPADIARQLQAVA